MKVLRILSLFLILMMKKNKINEDTDSELERILVQKSREKKKWEKRKLRSPQGGESKTRELLACILMIQKRIEFF